MPAGGGPSQPAASMPLVSIVDDDPSMREAMRFVLQANGFRVVTFESVEAFLAASAVSIWACLILDLRMPRMNGLDLLRRLAEAVDCPPVILVSAHLDDTIERVAHCAGASACIRKPFSDDVLVHVVRLALRL